ncbi:PIN domain-containing protein [Robbsia andropogonis]|uniref:PIN domain-containing protein n=1 Tax=Robbsia andropogonis TaxID=28092 RepID=UPI0020A0E21F|nr:PIN domain-containing protein [Robbsia andropogonis]MCP1121651.1 PIN domain-containing protein [Robbsia andropogonis]MCP1131471.1 PIN domain-containing protein [Robbsia andropogonis]
MRLSIQLQIGGRAGSRGVTLAAGRAESPAVVRIVRTRYPVAQKIHPTIARAMHIFVPDTNFFLQCLDYQRLDWSLATEELVITIAVPRAVQREIDRHKDGGNARRATRARKAWSTFAQVIDSNDNQITVTAGKRTISLELLMPKIKAEDFPDLDLQNPDDQIVSEVLWLRQQRSEDGVTFISNDTAALATAKSQRIPFQRLPEQWMLPPEKDNRDKTIEELRKSVARLSSQHPELAFNLHDQPEKQVSAQVTLFPALTATEIDSLAHEFSAQFPMTTDFPQEAPLRKNGSIFDLVSRSLNSLERWQPADAREVKHYQEKAYPAWLQQIRSDLTTIHHRLNGNLLSTFGLELANTGQKSANNLLVTFQAKGEIIFGVPLRRGDEEDTVQEKPAFTPPPTPPAGAYVNIADRFLAINAAKDYFARNFESNAVDLTGLWKEQRHDPNAFYWKPHRPKQRTTEWVLECDEFRHQHEPYATDISFLPTTEAVGNVTGAIRCLAHASNLPERVELVIPVRIQISRGDTVDQVRKELFGF